MTGSTSENTPTPAPMMDALLYHKYGGPEVMEINQIAVPVPGEGQVLVKVHCSSVNPIDCHNRSGIFKAMMHTPFPHTLGFDVSGTVEAVGSGDAAQAFKVGERVWSRSKVSDTLAEYCLVDADVLAPMPEGLSFVDGAAVPLTGLTALEGLRRAGITEGMDRVFISGGAGGVGSLAIQLAKHVYKAKEVVTTASAGAKTDLVKSLGADRVVDYRSEKFEEVLENKTFDVVYDTTGEAGRMGALPKQGGKVISISAAVTAQSLMEKGAKLNPIVKAVLWWKARKVVNPLKKEGAAYEFFFLKPSGPLLVEFGEYMRKGEVKAVIDSTHVGLPSFNDAFARLESNRAAGKVVVRVVTTDE